MTSTVQQTEDGGSVPSTPAYTGSQLIFPIAHILKPEETKDCLITAYVHFRKIFPGIYGLELRMEHVNTTPEQSSSIFMLNQ